MCNHDADMRIKGLNGPVSGVKTAVPAGPLPECSHDIDIKNMASWAMNYLGRTPRPQYNYQPVFQVFPLHFPSVRDGYDPIVDCDTDARMDWEWYYMRDIVGDGRYADVERHFHARMRSYINADGLAIANPGCYREDLPNAVYSEADSVIHVWGTTKLLRSLSEDYKRTKNPESKALARKIMLGLKKLFVWGEGENGAWCYAPNGMGPVYIDKAKNENSWGGQPDPVIGPLASYYLAASDDEALAFAHASARGIMENRHPTGIKFYPDGSFGSAASGDQPGASAERFGHTHASMHALWGIAELGLLAGDKHYIEFVKRSFDWMMTRGTGTGWFPAQPDNCNETCAISDMISIASLLGRAGYSEYFDYAERFFRNYIANLQFVLTPEMEAYYRTIHAGCPEAGVNRELEKLERVQGAIIGGSGINDYENALLGGVSGFCIFGCCAPEGMRAIHTIWSNTAIRENGNVFLPDGLYVNMAFNADNAAGRVNSYMPQAGGVRIKPAVSGRMFIRPPHWTGMEGLQLRVNGINREIRRLGAYIELDAAADDDIALSWPLISYSHISRVWHVTAPELAVGFDWLGNMVTDTDPPPKTGSQRLYTGKPRRNSEAPVV